MAFFKTTDGVSINYQDHEGQGPVAVLVSGFSGIQAEWANQVTLLQEQGYRVVTMDWRSHGRSERTSKNLRVSRLATDLQELITLLDLQDITLFGHSMGGSVIWAYLSLFGEQRLKQLVIVDETPKLLNDDTWSAGIKGLNWMTFDMVAPTFLKQRLTVTPVADDFKAMLQKEKDAAPFNFDLVYPLLRNHLLEDWRGDLYDCTLPTLFVAGGASPLCKPGYYHDFEGMFNKSSKVVVIPNTGHLPHLESPEEFNNEILTFLS
ncbi:hypothetical protein FPFC_021270 [Fructobacillus pseudoficulneus]|uniref:AB hydrolase-1 domain-containing protein n=1 Tax=Fructobacillus pseudoficulneus TaxID=220714 RepID=A0A3F3H7F9_9LACO|nr:alpha/beta hydrolase [Fructobacillus pseudoficulneus]GAP02679.1 hypothetical protein FPFC_021270 [Fructobacillus pseudoficulneus]SEH39035.1 Pimeloyl-ACP methyl ester carboxylesterase [Fructobacillus pseudoficulneus]